MGYFLYKGLNKPLIFFGLKGSYIYYAGGIIIGGFILIAIFSSIIGFLGILIGTAIIGGGLWMVFYIQDTRGLYKKTRNNNEIHIFPKRFKNRVILQNENKK